MKKCKSEGKKSWDPVETLVLPEAISLGSGRNEVHLQLVPQGRDFLALITGGQAHVGAVAVCDGRQYGYPEGERPGTIEMAGHREGPLAAEAAELLALASGRTCAASVGIHQDQATPAEIREIVANVRLGLEQLAAQMRPEGT